MGMVSLGWQALEYLSTHKKETAMKTKKWRQKCCLMLSLLLLFTGAFAVTANAATYNGVNYSTDWHTWKQGNPAWGSRKLGDLCTMSNSGCLITSIAILMAKSGAEDPNSFNPGVLRDRYESRGFVSHNSSSVAADGNLSYAAYSKSNSPNFYSVGSSNYHPTPYNQIYDDLNAHLSRGEYAIVNVNYGGHFVAVDYCSNGTVYIVDPAGTAKTTLKQYDGGIESATFFAAVKQPTQYNPQGCIDYVNGGKGTISVGGWAFDRDTPSKSTDVHVYVGGSAGSGAPGYAITANVSRPDVNSVYGLSGNHGYATTISVSKTGTQEVYFYAINEGGGTNVLIGHRSVYIEKPDTPTKKAQSITANSVIKTVGQKAFSLGAVAPGKLTYKSSNTKVATINASGKVTIKGAGITKITINAAATSSYEAASKQVTITVRPRSVTLKSLANSKKGKLLIKWKKGSGISGYKIQIAQNANFEGAKTYTIKTAGTVSKSVSVKKGKTYWVRIQTYKGSVSSGWSSIKKIKIKK